MYPPFLNKFGCEAVRVASHDRKATAWVFHWGIVVCGAADSLIQVLLLGWRLEDRAARVESVHEVPEGVGLLWKLPNGP
jgi:hypothetical protein